MRLVLACPSCYEYDGINTGWLARITRPLDRGGLHPTAANAFETHNGIDDWVEADNAWCSHCDWQHEGTDWRDQLVTIEAEEPEPEAAEEIVAVPNTNYAIEGQIVYRTGGAFIPAQQPDDAAILRILEGQQVNNRIIAQAPDARAFRRNVRIPGRRAVVADVDVPDNAVLLRMLTPETRVAYQAEAKKLIAEEKYMYRSCWVCNPANVGLFGLLDDQVLHCCDCNRLYYKQADITE